MAASNRAEAPNTVISTTLKRCREIDRDTTSSIDRTSDTGRPLACRNCSWIGGAEAVRFAARPDDPRDRRDADVERIQGIRHLPIGNVHVRLRIVVQSAITHVGCDADDLALPLFGQLLHDTRADHDPIVQRIAVLPELARHRLVDDHDRRCEAVIAIRECPATFDRDLEDVEVSRRDSEPCTAAMEGSLLERASHDPEWQAIATLERHATGRGGALDPGKRLQSLHPVAQQLIDACRLQVLRAGQRHAHRQHVARVEPGVHVTQRHERPNEQRGANQQ